MTTGLKTSVANSLLDAIARGVNYTAPVAFYVKLHTGDPGAAGASNAAGNTTRVSASMAAAASGSIASNTSTDWTNVNTAETYSHVSFWDAVTAGNFIGSNALTTPRTVAVGDNFSIPSGSLTLAITPLAA